MEDVLTVRVTGLGNDVGGISALEGRETLFIPGALPGETVKCMITQRKKRWARAQLLEILDESPHRVEPQCKYFGTCGGCSISHLDYRQQLFWKESWIRRALEKMHIHLPVDGIQDMAPSPEILQYRNRVSFDISQGKPGLHRFQGDTMTVDSCLLLNRTGALQFQRLRQLNLHGTRRVSVRSSDRTGDSMLEFRGNTPPAELLNDTSVTSAWNLEDQWFSSSGDEYMEEILSGFRFPVKPGIFFQVNPGAADIMVREISGVCSESSRVLDLYGGCGAFAIPLAAKGSEVISVELSEDASESGSKAAIDNCVTGVSFVNMGARNFLIDTVRKGENWDLVVVDPPRAGLGTGISRLLRRISAERMVYVSCNPFSLARDLSQITQNWTVQSVKPVDMFPQTDHMETIVELSRRGEET